MSGSSASSSLMERFAEVWLASCRSATSLFSHCCLNSKAVLSLLSHMIHKSVGNPSPVATWMKQKHYKLGVKSEKKNTCFLFTCTEVQAFIISASCHPCSWDCCLIVSKTFLMFSPSHMQERHILLNITEFSLTIIVCGNLRYTTGSFRKIHFLFHYKQNTTTSRGRSREI